MGAGGSALEGADVVVIARSRLPATTGLVGEARLRGQPWRDPHQRRRAQLVDTTR